MIDVLERLQYTCISTIPFLCLELQEDVVLFASFWEKHRHCSSGAGRFYCVDRHSDSNGGIRDGIPAMYNSHTIQAASLCQISIATYNKCLFNTLISQQSRFVPCEHVKNWDLAATSSLGLKDRPAVPQNVTLSI